MSPVPSLNLLREMAAGRTIEAFGLAVHRVASSSSTLNVACTAETASGAGKASRLLTTPRPTSSVRAPATRNRSESVWPSTSLWNSCDESTPPVQRSPRIVWPRHSSYSANGSCARAPDTATTTVTTASTPMMDRLALRVIVSSVFVLASADHRPDVRSDLADLHCGVADAGAGRAVG